MVLKVIGMEMGMAMAIEMGMGIGNGNGNGPEWMDTYFFSRLREVGTLPEDTSCEGCGGRNAGKV